MEGFLVLGRALSGLAENVLAVAHAQVAAFLVVGGPLAALHHEREVLLREVRQEVQIERRAEVVRVRDEHVLHARGEQLVKKPTPLERSIQIAMARRTPAKERDEEMPQSYYK